MDSQVQKLTAKGRATRQRIIEGAAAEIREYGVAVATLDDIMSRTDTSKSQLFHYFPDGKDQLLLAVAEHEAQRVLDDQQPYLGELTSWAAWRRWRDAVVDRYRRQGQNCPLSVLMSEIGRTTPGAQAVTAALMRQWHDEIAAGVRHMQEQGKVAGRLNAERVAAALLAGIQGGVGILLATGDLSYLEAALDSGIDSLRS
jgi:AcrR family transcriptional regulator